MGPFVPLLRSPELMTRLQLVGEYLRWGSDLDDDLVELVILTVARHWDQQFEWGFHHPIALSKGLTAETIAQVAARGRPTTGRPEVAVVWDLVQELQLTRAVSDEVYSAALGALGATGVVEVVGTVGYYTTLAMTMNMARTPPPPGAPRLPDAGEAATSETEEP
jgi:4-carboxymuconolactone decarboxylase